ncbi:MAG TPA: ShlB/FhaC/HecB family hemolysin secretion/activation protein, partial [Chlamydiales bacterium]|nr:ShlB/FhaC/HecB family hemolysin secretion/activation protein [Chlamydiales bacterium]
MKVLYLYLLIFPFLLLAETSNHLLQGILITSKNEQLASVEGIHFTQIEVPNQKKLMQKLQPFLNTKISMDLMNQVRNEIHSHFQNEGYPVLNVSLPVFQDLSQGSIAMVVNVSTVGNRVAEGGKYISENQILSSLRIKQGDMLHIDTIKEDVQKINRNPYVSTKVLLKKGEKSNTTDLQVQIKDRIPISVFTGGSYNGYQVAGDYRGFAKFQWGNLFGKNQIVSYLVRSAEQYHKWHSHQVKYSADIFNQDHLNVMGTYSYSEPPREKQIKTIGKSYSMALDYALTSLLKDLKVGYRFLRTNNFLSYEKKLIFNKYIDDSQFSISHSLHSKKANYQMSLNNRFVVSPGGMSKYNTVNEFNEERLGADSRYYYYRGKLNFNYQMNQFMSYNLKGFAQATTQKLIPVNCLSLCGMSAVRGYKENQYAVDSGAFVRNELNYSSSWMNLFSKKVKNVAGLFVDTGIGMGTIYKDIQKPFVASIGLSHQLAVLKW